MFSSSLLKELGWDYSPTDKKVAIIYFEKVPTNNGVSFFERESNFM